MERWLHEDRSRKNARRSLAVAQLPGKKARGCWVSRQREMLRAKGLRPVTRWVPDTRGPEFIQQYRAQRAVVAAKSEGNELWDWMDQVRSTEGWV